MERRCQAEERRKERLPASAEHRSKLRRRLRKFVGSPVAERHHIDLNEEYEVSYWSKELGVSADALKSAVQKAWPSVRAVRKHLGR